METQNAKDRRIALCCRVITYFKIVIPLSMALLVKIRNHDFNATHSSSSFTAGFLFFLIIPECSPYQDTASCILPVCCIGLVSVLPYQSEPFPEVLFLFGSGLTISNGSCHCEIYCEYSCKNNNDNAKHINNLQNKMLISFFHKFIHPIS